MMMSWINVPTKVFIQHVRTHVQSDYAVIHWQQQPENDPWKTLARAEAKGDHTLANLTLKQNDDREHAVSLRIYDNIVRIFCGNFEYAPRYACFLLVLYRILDIYHDIFATTVPFKNLWKWCTWTTTKGNFFHYFFWEKYGSCGSLNWSLFPFLSCSKWVN